MNPATKWLNKIKELHPGVYQLTYEWEHKECGTMYEACIIDLGSDIGLLIAQLQYIAQTCR